MFIRSPRPQINRWRETPNHTDMIEKRGLGNPTPTNRLGAVHCPHDCSVVMKCQQNLVCLKSIYEMAYEFDLQMFVAGVNGAHSGYDGVLLYCPFLQKSVGWAAQ